ncbi:hypothetical protein K2P47_03400 [Patescibacteria group bacterium]|nr:hypothetical protein [Patescibacteria group bacterium]
MSRESGTTANESLTEESERPINELSECQLYYRNVFPNATVYGRFENHPVTNTYTGPIAAVDEDSHAVAKRFYSYHKAALEKGVTFAGKYTISDWAYTGIGQMFAVVDVETGAVYPFPYVVDWDFEYRADSNLIVINPIDTMYKFDATSDESDVVCDAKWYGNMKTYYFIFEDNEFTLLGPEDISDLQTSWWLSPEPMMQ